VARELHLPSPDTVVFAPNTHDLLLRIVSGLERKPVRILSTDGEFHSFRRQAQRWEEAGEAVITRVRLHRIRSRPLTSGSSRRRKEAPLI